MFLALIRKQFKVLLRSPQELLILLLMPIVLILILSFALGSIMNSTNEAIEVELAVIQHDDEQQQIDAFLEKASKQMPSNPELEQTLQKILPVSILLNQILKDEDIKQFINVTYLEASDLENARTDGEFDAILEIPSGFTEDFFTTIFLNGEKPAFQVYLNENSQITSSVIQSILNTYQSQYSIMTQLTQNGLMSGDITLPEVEITSTIETLEMKEPITSSNYYTFSMSVMFILFMAGTISSQAFLEKNMHIFDRILLAQVKPLTYLAGIVVSTSMLAMVQMMILFTVTHFLFGIDFTQWQLYLLITFLLSVVVGGIAAILSAVNYRTNSAEASNMFSSAIVAIFAFIGGSFIDVMSFSPILANIGKWTPNGAALESYMILTQNGTFKEIQQYVSILAILAAICIVVAFLLFPRKGGMA